MRSSVVHVGSPSSGIHLEMQVRRWVNCSTWESQFFKMSSPEMTRVARISAAASGGTF